MVYFNTLPELNNAFAPMLASLQPGEPVLELGASSGRFIAQAKAAVGAGFCAAVDAVQGFLDTGIPLLPSLIFFGVAGPCLQHDAHASLAITQSASLLPTNTTHSLGSSTSPLYRPTTEHSQNHGAFSNAV
ncbi:hypothetical protein GQ44DRAFT_832549 [Phaeosphaeriaceae sp. PMI808]|nr:hypothetical protein GQ44DRAFT_833194 [Phaeosphaeriaceae sp. PMI808]KAH8695846.1 hypothetical protein GQ44DRAFT_832549 [Phaeosphaeriaceae sp. PMI808]